MVQSIFQGLYLHDYTKIKNLDIPITNNISLESYPAQSELVGTVITIKYRTLCNDREHLHAPAGDIVEVSAVVLRCDLEYPYKLIVLTLDEDDVILVGDNRVYENNMDYIFTHPAQQIYVDHYVKDYYGYSKSEGYYGTVIECDNGEPLQVIIAEYTGESVLRFVTGDEVISELLDNSEKDNQPDLVLAHSMLDSLQDKRIWF